jgi:cytochrome P450
MPSLYKEILDKHSAKTSSRPSFPVAQDIVSGGRRILFMEYTEQWRKIRSIIHQLFTPKMSATFRPSQLFESKQLTYDLLIHNEQQNEFYNHSRRYATSVIMTSTYGRRIPTWENEDVRQIFKIMEEFAEASHPTKWIAEVIPPLSRLPEVLQWWRPEALRYQERQNNLWMRYWRDLKKKIEDGTAPECFVKQFAESNYEGKGIDELQAAYTAGSESNSFRADC